jgi:YidC/Oxa1 family membrane protein insertase
MSFLKSLRGYMELQKHKDKEIVIWGDEKYFWVNFKGIIQHLTDDHGKVVYYVTSSPDDPNLEKRTDRFIPIYIGHKFFISLMFAFLNCRIFLLTVPDIGSFRLKRPPGAESMVYVQHSMCSLNMIYLPQAFDSYDVIMCAGPYHEKETREMESYYGAKPKTLFAAGYPPLDDLLQRAGRQAPAKNETPIATIAPSWHPGNIIELGAEPIIDSLLRAGFAVKLRPHPRTLERGREVVDRLIGRYAAERRFSLDATSGCLASYLETDVMITDWSGTVYKYAFSMLRPVIFINAPMKVRNEDYAGFKNIPVDIAWRSRIGAEIAPDALKTTGAVAAAVHNDTAMRGKIAALRDEMIYNVGCSSKRIADAIAASLPPNA